MNSIRDTHLYITKTGIPMLDFEADQYLPSGSSVCLKVDGVVVSAEIASVYKYPGSHWYLYTATRQLSFPEFVKDAGSNNMNMEQSNIKKVFVEQGLTKTEVELVLGAIAGVKVMPLLYSQANDAAEEILEAREYKSKVAEAVSLMGVDGPVRKPATRKTISREVVAAENKEAEQPAKKEDEKPVGPTRKTRSGSKATDKKESAEEIKDNVRKLGDGPTDEDDKLQIDL